MSKDPVKRSAQIEHKPWPLWGHGWVVELLRRIADGSDPTAQPRHAYLFLGSKQVGKSTLARLFAQALLCTAEGGRPCGQCRACQLVARQTHPDLRLIQPLDKDGGVDRVNGTLRSEQAVEIVRDVALRPVEGRYKIILIQDFQTANATFANRLLKTLEEPPEQVVLLLTATDRTLVLPTILSRCQQFELRAVDAATIEQALVQQWSVPPLKAQTLARLANGRLGWAVQQAQQATAEEERRNQIATILRLTQANRIERLAFAEKLAADRNSQHLFELLEIWTTWWRDVLLTLSGCAEACSNIDYQREIESLAGAISSERLLKYLQLLRYTDKVLHHTVSTRLALDVLLLQFPQVPSTARH